MSIAPKPEDNNSEQDADRQADGMKAQLRKDVDSWTSARRGASPPHLPGQIAKPSLPVGRPASPRLTAGQRTSSAAPPDAKRADTRSKPFSMSYGGETTDHYIEYMISRGAK
jgi:hypothetical protein